MSWAFRSSPRSQRPGGRRWPRRWPACGPGLAARSPWPLTSWRQASSTTASARAGPTGSPRRSGRTRRSRLWSSTGTEHTELRPLTLPSPASRLLTLDNGSMTTDDSGSGVTPEAPLLRATDERGLIIRPAGRVILLDPDDRVLLMRYDDGPPNGVHWCTPGGGLNAGEDYASGALRELTEETGWADITLL